MRISIVIFINISNTLIIPTDILILTGEPNSIRQRILLQHNPSTRRTCIVHILMPFATIIVCNNYHISGTCHQEPGWNGGADDAEYERSSQIWCSCRRQVWEYNGDEKIDHIQYIDKSNVWDESRLRRFHNRIYQEYLYNEGSLGPARAYPTCQWRNQKIEWERANF